MGYSCPSASRCYRSDGRRELPRLSSQALQGGGPDPVITSFLWEKQPRFPGTQCEGAGRGWSLGEGGCLLPLKAEAGGSWVGEGERKRMET